MTTSVIQLAWSHYIPTGIFINTVTSRLTSITPNTSDTRDIKIPNPFQPVKHTNAAYLDTGEFWRFASKVAAKLDTCSCYDQEIETFICIDFHDLFRNGD
jgi:hypothetical protein